MTDLDALRVINELARISEPVSSGEGELLTFEMGPRFTTQDERNRVSSPEFLSQHNSKSSTQQSIPAFTVASSAQTSAADAASRKESRDDLSPDAIDQLLGAFDWDPLDP